MQNHDENSTNAKENTSWIKMAMEARIEELEYMGTEEYKRNLDKINYLMMSSMENNNKNCYATQLRGISVGGISAEWENSFHNESMRNFGNNDIYVTHYEEIKIRLPFARFRKKHIERNMRDFVKVLYVRHDNNGKCAMIRKLGNSYGGYFSSLFSFKIHVSSKKENFNQVVDIYVASLKQKGFNVIE